MVTERTTGPKSGKFIERLGFYHAKTGKRDINADRAKHWLSMGALPSDTVHNFLVNSKIITAKKINHIPTKKTAGAKKAEAEIIVEEKTPEAPTEKEVETEATMEEPPSE